MSDIAKMIAIAKKFGGGSSTPAPVVILPETETPELNPGSQYSLYTAPENAPIEGVTYKVTWSGGEYDSLAVDASAVWDMPSGSMFLLGNSDMMNLTTQIGSNPAPDAPFLLMLTPIGATEDGVTNYGTIFNDADVIANPTPVISIVEAAKTESAGGGGVFTVNTTYTAYNTDTGHDFGTFDRTWGELWAALEAGKLISIRAVYVVNSTPSGNLYGHVISAARNGADTLCVVSIPMTFFGGTDIRYHLSDDGNGGIAAKRATD